MDIISVIFGVITSAITNFITSMTAALSGVTSLFYVEAEGTDPAHMTFLGVLLLITVGVAIVYWAFLLKK